jgi:hypothetical protein
MGANGSGEEVILVEGEDFYREGAAVVFTARFLRRRGYCCGNGCRHCPYGEAAREGAAVRKADDEGGRVKVS